MFGLYLNDKLFLILKNLLDLDLTHLAVILRGIFNFRFYTLNE